MSATCMGGLGRQIPGSYAEYTCVAEANIRPSKTIRLFTFSNHEERILY